MEWKVVGLCPQCGGEVTFEAGTHLFHCSFCRTNLHMITNGPLCYMIPPWKGLDGPEEHIVHIPYWRFKGMRYRVVGRNKIEAGALDTTAVACTGLPVEASLGIRPQVGVLRLIPDSRYMLPHNRPAREAIEHISARLQLLDNHSAHGIERFIGETKCLIYAPFKMARVKGPPSGKGVWRLAPLWDRDNENVWRSLSAQAVARIKRGLMQVMAPGYRFFPLICPECGFDLPALSGAIVYPCQGCSRVWQVNGDGLTQIEYRLYNPPSGITDPVFLPFWRLSMTLGGMPVKNRGQLSRFVISYRTIPRKWDNQPVTLFVPAFKLNPRLFLKVAKWMSLANIVEDSAAGLDEPMGLHAVSLPLEEAAQAIKIVLAELFKGNNPRLLGMIKECRLKVDNAFLTFLPFKKQVMELVDAFSGHAIPKAALL